MGTADSIKGLTQVIQDNAPNAIKQTEIKTLFGRKIAIDASMSIYQFLIAVRQNDGQQLQTESGETTSHLVGLFSRTVRMIENGIKPVYVFDGKPPSLKSVVLKKRFARREEATEEGEEAKETGTIEDMDRASRRTVKVTREHNEECRKLLRLMGVPYVDAPSEAEAQCAELCRGGLVYGAGSEDMDTLTFGAPVLLRHLTFSEARKMPIDVINLAEVLKGLDMDMDKFIDFCILCGCDYLEPLKKIGGKTALKHIRERGSIDGVLEYLRTKTNKDGAVANPPPEEWPYEEARELFRKPEVIPSKEIELKWEAPDADGLMAWLVGEKGFAEDRVKRGVEKLKNALASKQQGRLDGFFKTDPKVTTKGAVNPAKNKRKAEQEKEKDELKRQKTEKRKEQAAARKAKKVAEKTEAAKKSNAEEDSE